MLETTTMVLVSELAVDYFAFDGEGFFFISKSLRELFGARWSDFLQPFFSISRASYEAPSSANVSQLGDQLWLIQEDGCHCNVNLPLFYDFPPWRGFCTLVWYVAFRWFLTVPVPLLLFLTATETSLGKTDDALPQRWIRRLFIQTDSRHGWRRRHVRIHQAPL